ncbi:MAG: hypothetical protein ABSB71_07970 [Candidatus Bathyarchaeia archaeon]|jgi:nitrogen fixation protein
MSEVKSDNFKAGYFTVHIPQKDLDMGIYHFTVYVPKTELSDPNKKGKIGSYQIQVLPTGKIFGKPLKEIPILRSMLSKYTTIDLVVQES